MAKRAENVRMVPIASKANGTCRAMLGTSALQILCFGSGCLIKIDQLPN